ncbi:MAG: serine/threonine-protein phosphatase [Clostridia bacterium]|nr:serine/threonine-protein phosphatase [Clostridia bacterium]
MIEYATISETGEKEKNEDAVKVFINKTFFAYGFVLADGLGGHGNGDVASGFAVDCAGAVIENTPDFGETFLNQCFEETQRMLMKEKEKRDLPSIKTTMVVLTLKDGFARWGHIGDSRLYHFRGGKQLSRTLDHSVPQMLVLSGEIKEKDIRHHPDRSILLNALGAEWNGPQYEISKQDVKVETGDSFLLCSDGFWEWIDEKNMLKILKKSETAYEALNEMAAAVKENGTGHGMDNYSAILVNIK